MTKKSFAYADVLLTQLSFILEINEANWYWFALTYNNVGLYGFDGMWNKLQSRQYCERIMPLFGVKTVEELINLIKKHPVEREYRYSNLIYTIPSIPYQFKEYAIASLK